MNNTVIVEIAATVLIVAYVIYFYTNMTPEELQTPFTSTYRKMVEEFHDPKSLMYMTVYLIIIYGVIYLAGVKRVNGKYPHTIRFLEYKTWIYIFILLGVQLGNVVPFIKLK